MAKKKDALSVVTKFYEIKEAKTEDGTIEGYASVFENVDNSSDRMMRGCFSRYLTEQKDNNLIKLTYNHRDVIGKTIDVTEDDKGLFFRGKILKTSKGADVLELVKGGALSHMSIKFAFMKDGFTKNKFGGRDFNEVKILDCSVVDWPDNEMTSVEAKDYNERLNAIYDMVLEIKEKLLPTAEGEHGEAEPEAEKPETDEGARGGDSEVDGKDGDEPVFGDLIEKMKQKIGELERKQKAGEISRLAQLIKSKL